MLISKEGRHITFEIIWLLFWVCLKIHLQNGFQVIQGSTSWKDGETMGLLHPTDEVYTKCQCNIIDLQYYKATAWEQCVKLGGLVNHTIWQKDILRSLMQTVRFKRETVAAVWRRINSTCTVHNKSLFVVNVVTKKLKYSAYTRRNDQFMVEHPCLSGYPEDMQSFYNVCESLTDGTIPPNYLVYSKEN